MKTKCICIPTSKFKQSLVKRERDRYGDYEDRDTIDSNSSRKFGLYVYTQMEPRTHRWNETIGCG